MTEEPTFTLRLTDGQSFGPATLEEIKAWAREGRVPKDGLLFPTAGGEPRSVLGEPDLARLLEAPPTASTGLPNPEDSPGPALIPYRNGPALAGYYTSVASIIPVIAIILGPVAILLGVIGLVKVKKNPMVRGTAHAIVAIVLGLLTSAVNIAVVILSLLSIP